VPPLNLLIVADIYAQRMSKSKQQRSSPLLIAANIIGRFVIACPGRFMSTPIIDGKATVFVVDDNLDVCEGIKGLVESVGLRCQVYGSPEGFLQRSPTDGPSCLILDVRLPKMSGLDLQADLARDPKSPATIIISGYGDIPMTVQAMKVGAVAFLTKPLRAQDLLDAVFEALDKHRVRLDHEDELAELRGRFQMLSFRERQIMPLITAGLLNKQIASQIDQSEITVKVHRHKLMAKLKAKSVPDLVRMADALGVRNGNSANPRTQAMNVNALTAVT
jgi:FixJ family two-component response regulator